MYLDEPQCDYDIDPLQWYKERQQKYPTIVKLARLVSHRMILLSNTASEPNLNECSKVANNRGITGNCHQNRQHGGSVFLE